MTKEKLIDSLWVAFLVAVVGGFCVGAGAYTWKSTACRTEREVRQEAQEERKDRERKADGRRDWVLRCAERERRYNVYEDKWSEPETGACLDLLQSVESALAAEKPKVILQ